MMSEWKEYKLGDVLNVKHGFAFKGEFFSTVPTNDILLSPGNFNIGGGFKSDKFKFYNGNYPESYVLKENDVIVTMTDLSKEGDTLGYGAKIPPHQGIRYLHNQRLGLVELKDNSVNLNFIYWLLRTRKYQQFIVSSATGTTVKHTSPTRIGEYSFFAPDLPTQTAIAEILSSLDDKIELNNNINKELEKLAQTLFKQWFIEFEFPDENGEPYQSSGGEMVESELGMIPKNWEIVTLNKLLTVKYGKDHKHLADGNVPLYGSGGIMRFVEKPLYSKESILIPRKGTLSNLFYLSEPFWSVDTMFYTEIHNASFGKYLFFVIKSLNLAAMDVGSAVPSMTTKVLNGIKVLKPVDFVMLQFDEIASSIFEKMNHNTKENQELSNLRDTLLPKLISGELNVKDL